MQAGILVHMVGARAERAFFGERGACGKEWAGYKSGTRVIGLGQNWVASKVAGRRRESTRACATSTMYPM